MVVLMSNVRYIIACVVVVILVTVTASAQDISWFDKQRKGANCEHKHAPGPEYWEAVSDVGIEFIRLAPNSWETDAKDFLVGDADEFTALHEPDLALLIKVLDDAHAAGIKIVLTMFVLPGARWIQLNDDVDDRRMWTDLEYHEQAARFWGQLAARLQDHPAIIAYDPLNEPHPEKIHGFQHSRSPGFLEWADSARGTAADVNVFNRRIVRAIREVDPDVPIIIEAGFYSSPAGFKRLDPMNDNAVMYSFHFYEPWEFATFRVNKGRFAYPDRMPGYGDVETIPWSIDDIHSRMATVNMWAESNNIPANRVILSEYGCDRRVEGAEQYLSDIITVANEEGWHWAFYAFRGDGGWNGLDYELGTDKPGGKYWEAIERGEDPETLKNRHENSLWEVIRREFD